MRRREFITLLGGVAATWPWVARGQQAGMPVIGYLSAGTPELNPDQTAAFYQGLRAAGYVEGQNVTIDYRWAGDQQDLLRALAADLVRRKVSVIYATGSSTVAQVAKAATATIPIVFTSGADPVKLGLVGSLNRPGGNVTGVTFFSHVLSAKRLTLLHDLVPRAATIAVLINPSEAGVETDLDELQTAGRVLGLRLQPLYATNEREIDAAFSAMAQNPPGALFLAAGSYFFNRRNQIIAHAARLQIPTIYPRREIVAAGGLISYATQALDANRLAGTYVGRILKGEKPGDLPVQQPTKIELAINLRTAKALGLDIPVNLLALADEVIE